MSEANVGIVSQFVRQLMATAGDHQSDRRLQGAKLQRGEYDPGSRAVLDFLHPNATWTTRIGEVYEGKVNCARFAGQAMEAWEDYSLSLREITDLGGDQVLAEWEVEMRGAASGIWGRSTIFAMFTLRNGLICRVVESSNRAEALKAVGLADGVAVGCRRPQHSR